MLQRGGVLDAGKTNVMKTVRMTNREVLMTGGLLVHQEGTVQMKKDGIMKSWKNKYVVLYEGELRIYDARQKCRNFSSIVVSLPFAR